MAPVAKLVVDVPEAEVKLAHLLSQLIQSLSVKRGLALDLEYVGSLLLLCVPDVGHEGIEVPQSGVSWVGALGSWVCCWLRGGTGSVPGTSWLRWRR